MEPDQRDDISFFDLNDLPKNLIDADRQSLEQIFKSKNCSFTSFGYER